jgi:glycosyltransferase involved in cell wall biosynthesis
MKTESHSNLPLISCICVTENRPRLLKRAIDCYNSQTYQNKQLVILYKDNDLATSDFIRNTLFTNSIKTIKIPNNRPKSLGIIRNIAIKNADGEFICIWDDDDWYHMNRISIQYQKIVDYNKQGSILTQCLMFDEVKNKAYISLKRNYWEGSLLCKKKVVLRKKYPNKSKGEDTPLVEYLYTTNKLVKIENMANIYIYVYHGSNTCDYDHFKLLFNRSQELPEFSITIKELLDGRISPSCNSILSNTLCLSKVINK